MPQLLPCGLRLLCISCSAIWRARSSRFRAARVYCRCRCSRRRRFQLRQRICPVLFQCSFRIFRRGLMWGRLRSSGTWQRYGPWWFCPLPGARKKDRHGLSAHSLCCCEWFLIHVPGKRLHRRSADAISWLLPDMTCSPASV